MAWESPQDGSGLGIFGQRYKNDGTKNGGEFQVNTYTTNDQRNPSVAIDGNGNFVVVWDSLGQDGSLQGIYAQRYNSDGTTRGAEFRVNTYTTSTQSSPSVAMDGTGAFVVVWQSFGQDGDEYGVFGQRFNIVDCPALSVTAPAPASQTTCEGGSATFSVSATGTVPIAYQWRKNGVNLDDGTFIFGSHAPTMTIHQMSSVDQGNYDCVVTDYCLPARTLTSSTAVLNFNASQSLGAVQTLGVQKVNGGASLKFNWTNISGAVDYVVLEDTVPSGPFFTTTGSAVNGADGLTVAVGTGTKFYLVAGRNSTCGIGPKE